MRRSVRTSIGVTGAAVAITGIASGCVYNTPSPGASSLFSDVATVSNTDVWAVGATEVSSTVSRALIEHFDGHNWTVVTPPSTAGSVLSSITAVSATDVWAVGGGHTLHWDGRTWTATADPANLEVEKVEHGHGGLVMALGLDTSTHAVEVLARTATNWEPVPNPTPPVRTSGRPCDGALDLNSLTLLTTSDIWVAGGTVNTGNTITAECPYAAHWNGSAWTTYAPPDPTTSAEGAFVAISARTDGTVWAVGNGRFTQGQTVNQVGFADRYIRGSWQSLCQFGCEDSAFTDIDATGTNVWLSGINSKQTAGSVQALMYIKRWIGNGWANQATQQIPPGQPKDFLTSISVRGGVVTSAGFFLGTNRENPLIDIRNDG